MIAERTAGLTIVGLLTTLTVLSVLLAIGLPAWQGMLDRQRHRALQQLLADRLAEARAQARLLARPVSIVFVVDDGGRRWCFALDDRGGCDCRRARCRLAGRPTRTFTDRDYPGIAIEVRPRHGRITFHPVRGTASAGSIRLIGRRGERRLVVASSGRIRRCVLGSPGAPPCGGGR